MPCMRLVYYGNWSTVATLLTCTAGRAGGQVSALPVPYRKRAGEADLMRDLFIFCFSWSRPCLPAGDARRETFFLSLFVFFFRNKNRFIILEKEVT